MESDASVFATSPFLGGPPRQRRSSPVQCLLYSCVTAAAVFALSGLVLSAIAVALPSWQTVHLTEDIHEHGHSYSMHEHGLWKDCSINIRKGYDPVPGSENCIYKWDYPEMGSVVALDDATPEHEAEKYHHFDDYHVATLCLLGCALISALVSVCTSCCACVARSATVVLVAMCLLTLALTIAGTTIFFFYAHQADNRFITISSVTTHAQEYGNAFYIQLFAGGAHAVAFVLAMVAMFLWSAVRRAEGDDDLQNAREMVSVSQMSQSTGPNIQRTLEIDPPLLYQQTTGMQAPGPVPHYTKHTSSYRSPVSSTPELPPPRLPRRDSETCV